MKRRYLIWGFAAATSALVLTALAVVGVYWSIRHRPAFYHQTAAASPERQAIAADRFEKNVLELRNETVREGQWQVTLTDDEINGWLAAKLPAAFPNLLPGSVSEPRVSIEQNQLLIGCQYSNSWVSTVFNVRLEPFLAEGKNQIAVRIRAARAGSLPLPLKSFMETVSQSAEKAKINLRWRQEGGDPIALIELPTSQSGKSAFELDSLQAQPGKLLVTGRTFLKKTAPKITVD